MKKIAGSVIWVVVAVVVVGIVASGGPARNPDGSVNPSRTLEQGADEGGKIAGRAVDDAGNALGGGLGRVISESDLAKIGAAGAGAAAVAKYGPKFKPKPATTPPAAPTPTATTQPPKRRTGWCKDILTGAVVPCAPSPSSTSTTGNPMSSGWSAPTFRLPEATWKPCVVTPGQVVSC